MLKIEKKNQFLFGVIICLISAIMFSSKGVIVKLIFNVSTINSIGVLSLRMLFAFPFYLAVAIYFLRKEKAFPFKGKQWIQMLALGLLGYYCSSFFLPYHSFDPFFFLFKEKDKHFSGFRACNNLSRYFHCI